MDVTLDLPEEVEEAYLADAQAKGISLADHLREVLIARKPVTPKEELSPEEWVRRFRAWRESHPNYDLPILSDEAISREAIYEERGL